MTTRDDDDTQNLQLNRNLTEALSQDIFSNIVEHFPDIIHSVDQKGKLISVNKKATELLGYSKEELLGKNIFEIYADEIAQEVKSGFSELKKSGYLDGIESKLKAKNGNIIDVEIRSLSLYDDEGKFVKTFSIIRDIREMKSMKMQLVQQSKLAALGELAAGIIHDIRNPLTVIMATSDHVLQQAILKKSFEKIENAREKITKASNRILRLTDHLRAFSRSEIEEMNEFSLKGLIEDSLLMVESRILECGAKLINNISDSEIMIQGRENQIEQVVINLISNACDALLECELREIYLDYRKESDFHLISVRDTGMGISNDHKESIFHAFFTTKGKGKGTGLGLSICAGIIDEHSGKLVVESEVGKGATFIIKLPCSRDSTH